MSHNAKKLNGTNLPNRWTVEVNYRDGSSPTIFMVEDLEDIDERMEVMMGDRFSTSMVTVAIAAAEDSRSASDSGSIFDLHQLSGCSRRRDF